MEVLNVKDRKDQKIETFPYKGKPYEVKEVWVRWLSQAGPEGSPPEYGLRYFTIGPGGNIPIHNHFYHQTMYILSGRVGVMAHDAETEAVVEERFLEAHDLVYLPSMEPHSIENTSDSESVTFLCCIGNVYEE